MATATKKGLTTGQRVSDTASQSELASLKFLIFEDNGGAFHWRIAAGNGGTLAQSPSFASYDEAAQAARHVRDAAGSASLEQRHGGATRGRPEARASAR